jgi:hypothetical protein
MLIKYIYTCSRFNQLFNVFQYILNVTSDLPNTFEEQGCIKYMQIPISDHIGQNLASFFPQAIEFIGELYLTYILLFPRLIYDQSSFWDFFL